LRSLPPLPRLFPYTTLFRSGEDTMRAAEEPPAARLADLQRDVALDLMQLALVVVVELDEELAVEVAWQRDFDLAAHGVEVEIVTDRKSTRLNSSHQIISYAV